MAKLGVYALITSIVAIVVVLQVMLAKGNLPLILALSLFNGALVAAFNMRLKDEPLWPTVLVFVSAAAMVLVYTLGIVLS